MKVRDQGDLDPLPPRVIMSTAILDLLVISTQASCVPVDHSFLARTRDDAGTWRVGPLGVRMEARKCGVGVVSTYALPHEYKMRCNECLEWIARGGRCNAMQSCQCANGNGNQQAAVTLMKGVQNEFIEPPLAFGRVNSVNIAISNLKSSDEPPYCQAWVHGSAAMMWNVRNPESKEEE
ncbi:Os02g0705201 [Oryza sativa Japonica Group]|uniref:Os02g0705201 protein n=1 Tax=Oryza sativa subsp. japonica TaxID=39947 RepID=A0A0P0VNI3_ORYSJ|nr:Os02g0705201 [Oryza sativa Japonica Group]